MPGLCGVASFDPDVDVQRVHGDLRAACVSHQYRHDLQLHRPSCGMAASAMSDTFALATHEQATGSVSIMLEGWISDIDGAGPCSTSPTALHEKLTELYHREGTAFVDRLHGSFTMMLADAARGRICLFVDHSASRPLFWTIRDGQLIWASDLSTLLLLPDRDWTLSRSSIANFVSCGHHLGDGTWIEGVRRIPPGHLAVWSARGSGHETYFDYHPGADAEPDADLDELADDLAEAVLHSAARCLRVSSEPVVTLSGGLDSRLVLGALLEVGATNIRTTTWGCESDYVHGDGHVAARLAGTLGLEHRFIERRDDYLLLPQFTRLFGTETDAATYHIGESDVLDRLLSEGWSRSIYRGDECFGWLGGVHSPEEAMAALGIRPLDRLTVRLDGVFRDDAWRHMTAAQRSCIEEIISASSQEHPVDLKDRWYFEHRLARYLHPATDYKRSRVEVFNPLLDKDILNILRRVPPRFRLYKQIESRLMQRHFAHLMKVPLASRASIPDATRRWREDPKLSSFMLTTLTAEGSLWSRLVNTSGLAEMAKATLTGASSARGNARWFAGRLLRSVGLYEPYKRLSWRPLGHAQPSAIQLLQRLLAMRSWLDVHEEHLTLEM